MKISVVIPIYNGERYIEQTIISILEQPYKDFSFVLIDTSSGTPVYKVYLTDGHKKIDGATKKELYDTSVERYKLVLDDDFKEGHINSEVGAC